MKIGFDAKRLFNNFTGLGNYSRTLVRNLQKYFPENEFHLYTPKLIKNRETAYFFDQAKFSIHTCPHKFNWYWRQFQLTGLIKQHRLDVFHGLSHELPNKIDTIENCKTILSFHDLIYEKYPEQFPYFDRLGYQRKYKRSAQLADVVVSISKSTEKDLLELYKIKKDKIQVIYQTCHDVFFNEGTLKNPSPFQNYFLYVGSIIPRKGLKKIVEAYSVIGDDSMIPIVVIGNGKQYFEEVKESIDQYQLGNKFHFIHQVDNDVLPAYYQNARALVFPSIYEGFGIPAIESLLSNTPVITSNVSSLPEAAGEGSILIDPLDVQALAKALKQLNDDPERATKLGEQGRNYAVKTFHPKHVTSQVFKSYTA